MTSKVTKRTILKKGCPVNLISQRVLRILRALSLIVLYFMISFGFFRGLACSLLVGFFSNMFVWFKLLYHIVYQRNQVVRFLV
jgi:hypothetical protein